MVRPNNQGFPSMNTLCRGQPSRSASVRTRAQRTLPGLGHTLTLPHQTSPKLSWQVLPLAPDIHQDTSPADPILDFSPCLLPSRKSTQPILPAVLPVPPARVVGPHLDFVGFPLPHAAHAGLHLEALVHLHVQVPPPRTDGRQEQVQLQHRGRLIDRLQVVLEQPEVVDVHGGEKVARHRVQLQQVHQVGRDTALGVPGPQQDGGGQPERTGFTRAAEVAQPLRSLQRSFDHHTFNKRTMIQTPKGLLQCTGSQ
jgi:hypothetical protein